jgi:tetratricopeptide (TPR) repeat protein
MDAAIIATCFFALTPVNADTIAWVSTRSTLLFTLFYLISLFFYVKHYESKNIMYLIVSILTYLFSCFSKSTAVTLPIILLVVDFYFRRKINRQLWLEKIPYFVLAIAFGMITLRLRNDSGIIHTVAGFTIIDRAFLFTYSIDFFLMKFALPFKLSLLGTYPFKINGFLPFIYYFSPLILAATVFSMLKFSRDKRSVLFALSIVVITLALNLVTLLEDGFLAMRYAYLPSAGFGILIAFIYSEMKHINFYQRFKKLFSAIGIVIVLLFSWMIFQRTLVWKDTLTLFDDVLEKNEQNVFAYNSRGIARYELNDIPGSIADYSKAIEIDPRYDAAYYNRAISYYRSSQPELAFNDYNKSIGLNNTFSKAYVGRGIIYMDVLNKPAEAAADFSSAININPGFAQAYYNRGLAYSKLNDPDHACSDWKMVQSMGYDRADQLILRYCR